MQAPAVLSCQYASWYRHFGHLAFKSKLIELPQDFIDYLLQDGVFLSESSSAVSISPSHAFPVSLRIQKHESYEREPHCRYLSVTAAKESSTRSMGHRLPGLGRRGAA